MLSLILILLHGKVLFDTAWICKLNINTFVTSKQIAGCCKIYWSKSLLWIESFKWGSYQTNCLHANHTLWNDIDSRTLCLHRCWCGLWHCNVVQYIIILHVALQWQQQKWIRPQTNKGMDELQDVFLHFDPIIMVPHLMPWIGVYHGEMDVIQWMW